uniref:Uncharacterized protein n=1 Tax=Arundo donax TaxID=35708 RepID=A0A0A8ZQD4_ARUDO
MNFKKLEKSYLAIGMWETRSRTEGKLSLQDKRLLRHLLKNA